MYGEKEKLSTALANSGDKELRRCALSTQLCPFSGLGGVSSEKSDSLVEDSDLLNDDYVSLSEEDFGAMMSPQDQAR